MGIDGTHKMTGEGAKRPWPPLIRMTEQIKARINKLR